MDLENNLKLRHLSVGKPDARQELSFADGPTRRLFEQSYLVPENIDIDEYINGQRFYVYGLKGTGKTALLQYVNIKALQTPGTRTQFILFKSQISEEDRKELAHGASNVVVQNNRTGLDDDDYEDMWRWFLYRQLADLINASNTAAVARNDDLDRFLGCVSVALDEKASSGIRRFLPKLNKGSVEISARPKVKLDFDWEDKGQTRVPFSRLVSQADQLFARLRPGAGRLYLLIDELELKVGSKKQFERDARLIRDLVVSVYKLNEITHEQSGFVRVVCAIRSEVLHSVAAFGKEIEKSIQGFGRKLSWEDAKPADGDLHPLIVMMCRKIQRSEAQNNISSDPHPSAIWGRYFKSVHGSMDPQSLLHRTWYRPRDLVRLLNLIQERFPDAKAFSDTHMLSVQRDYSKQSWIELAAELHTKYRENLVQAIADCFTQFKPRFTLDEFIARLRALASVQSEVARLHKEFKPGDVLNDLYRAGAIGNAEPTVRFVFRGDPFLNLYAPMMVHPALRPVFSLTSRAHQAAKAVRVFRRR